MPLHIIILAAGQGTRMYSQKPKVLHEIGGKPMLRRVVETALELKPEKIHVIIGHEGDKIQNELSDLPVHWVTQEQQLGTGHAVMQAMPHIADEQSQVLILSADVPLIKAETLSLLLQKTDAKDARFSALALLLAFMPDPTGLGRIVRDESNNVLAIVEEKDATEEQRAIREIYSGICCANYTDLNRWLPQLGNHNAQKEYYLTEIIALAVAQNYPIVSQHAQSIFEISGVNNRYQLQELERVWQMQYAKSLMLSGVALADARRLDVRGELHCGRDVFIDANNVFEGTVTLGNESIIEPNCVLKNVTIGNHCRVLAHSVLEDCHLGDHTQVGPFARIRPGTKLGQFCKIGNFVEAKNAVFADHSKASHLSYLGDVQVGENVNIGAGTITCNYDGCNKHQTIIEDGAFIGSDTQLVAPVKVGKNATIGAGSTIRKDAPPDALTLTEAKQKTVQGWSRPKPLGKTYKDKNESN